MVETSLGLNVQNFAVAFKVDPKVLEWLQKGGILEREGIASLAAKEELVDARFIRRELFPGGVERFRWTAGLRLPRSLLRRGGLRTLSALEPPRHGCTGGLRPGPRVPRRSLGAVWLFYTCVPRRSLGAVWHKSFETLRVSCLARIPVCYETLPAGCLAH